MADIQAFRAIRYGSGSGLGRDLSAVIAPPYDVLDEGDKSRLTAQSNHNIVTIDLPFIPPKKAGPDKLYQQAATTMNEWLDAGVLARDEQPAFYLYHQSFQWEGREYTRRLFFARLRLEPFGEGSVFPHEQTFGGPKEDRLKLMKATRCQLSPVFGLYLDPAGKIMSALEEKLVSEPDVTAVMEDVANRLWAVTDPETIAAVRDAMSDKKIYVADGHHRYSTALMYRDWLAEQEGELPPDHPARFVLMALAVMEDPGMLILPTHRVLVGIDDLTDEQIMDAWKAGLDIASADQIDLDADFNLFSGRSGQRWTAKIKDRDVLRKLEPKEPEAWAALDMAYLHRYLLDELLVKKLRGGKELTIRYVKSLGDAEQTAQDEKGLAVIAQATRMDQLRAVAEAGGLMPQKSTFFFPKVATGLIINPLYD
jgi:uncharacterized protein (DUF1015 family)